MKDLKITEYKATKGQKEYFVVHEDRGGYFEKRRFENRKKLLAYIKAIKEKKECDIDSCDVWIERLENYSEG